MQCRNETTKPAILTTEHEWEIIPEGNEISASEERRRSLVYALSRPIEYKEVVFDEDLRTVLIRANLNYMVDIVTQTREWLMENIDEAEYFMPEIELVLERHSLSIGMAIEPDILGEVDFETSKHNVIYY